MRSRRTWLIGSGVAVLLAGGIFYFWFLREKLTDSRLHATLKPLFEERHVNAPFVVSTKTQGSQTSIHVKFEPAEKDKQRYAKKNFLLIPLVITAYNAEPHLKQLSKIEIQTTNEDDELASLHCDPEIIRSFIDHKSSLPVFSEMVAYQIVPWKADGLTKEKQAGQYLVHARYLANEKGQSQQALPFLEKARELAPDDFEVNFALGAGYFVMGQNEIAVRQLEKCLMIDPGEIRTYPLLSQVNIRLGQKQNAAKLLKSFQERYRGWNNDTPKDDYFKAALYQAAEAYYFLGEEKEAEELALDYTRHYQNQPEGFYLVGRIALHRNDSRKARDFFHQAVSHDPKDGWSWLFLGHALLNLRQYQDSTTAYRKSYSCGVRDVSLFLGLSDAYLQLGRFVDARHVAGDGFNYHKNQALEDHYCTAYHAILTKGLAPNSPPTPLGISD